MTQPDEKSLEIYLNPVRKRKVLSAIAIDVSQLTSYADTIVILEGASKRQVVSLSEHIIKQLKDKGIKILSREGVKEGEWALLDFGDIIFHVFETSVKQLYDLEGLWADAPRLDLSAFDLNLEKQGNEQ